MGWVAHRAFERADGTPAAVYDRGDLGKEAITRLLAPDPETAIDQALALAEGNRGRLKSLSKTFFLPVYRATERYNRL